MSEKQDYATPEREAIYLEIGWSDYLLRKTVSATVYSPLSYPNPLHHYVTPTFYTEVAALAKNWSSEQSLQVSNYCDLGGGPSRTVVEIDSRFPDLEQIHLVEPSKIFCEWADQLRNCEDDLPDIPVLHSVGTIKRVAPVSRPPQISNSKQRLSIVNTTLENYKVDFRFDLITCLNVIDRHYNPTIVVDKIAELINDNGLLVLSCPFDYQESVTPDKEHWVSDLSALFSGNDCWSQTGQAELFYDYRSSNRSWTRLCSQVVGMKFRQI